MSIIILPNTWPTETWPPQQTHKCLDAEGNEVECTTDYDPRPYDFLYTVKCPASTVAPEAVEAVLYGSCTGTDQPDLHACRATILCRERLVAPEALPEPTVVMGLIAAAFILVSIWFLKKILHPIRIYKKTGWK